MISIDNKSFSSDFFETMRDEIVANFERFEIYVADDLMVYNKFVDVYSAIHFNKVQPSYIEDGRK